MVVGIEFRLQSGQSFGFFSEPFGKKCVMNIQDLYFYSDDHFMSHLSENGLYTFSKVSLILNVLLTITSELNFENF